MCPGGQRDSRSGDQEEMDYKGQEFNTINSEVTVLLLKPSLGIEY